MSENISNCTDWLFFCLFSQAARRTRRWTSPSRCPCPGALTSVCCTATVSRWCTAPAWPSPPQAISSPSPCESLRPRQPAASHGNTPEGLICFPAFTVVFPGVLWAFSDKCVLCGVVKPKEHTSQPDLIMPTASSEQRDPYLTDNTLIHLLISDLKCGCHSGGKTQQFSLNLSEIFTWQFSLNKFSRKKNMYKHEHKDDKPVDKKRGQSVYSGSLVQRVSLSVSGCCKVLGSIPNEESLSSRHTKGEMS